MDDPQGWTPKSGRTLEPWDDAGAGADQRDGTAQVDTQEPARRDTTTIAGHGLA
jgi:hypothetical protein